MDFALILPDWLDALLIAPFRWPAIADIGMLLGSALLVLYCTIIGELTSAVLFLLHRRHYSSMEDGMVRYHNLSVEALHAGNKEAYLAANKMAQEDFGKSFFAQATIGMASLWPLPFALGWMSLRFEDIVLYTVPWIHKELEYPFLVISLYILCRVLFSKYCKKHIPLFKRIAAIKDEARRKRGEYKSFFARQTPPSDEDKTS